MADPAEPGSGESPGSRKETTPSESRAPYSAEESLLSASYGSPVSESAEDRLDLYVAFYREYISRLAAFLVWNGASLTVAADIAQETMIDAYRGWAKIEHPAAWAKKVASRKYARYIGTLDVVAPPTSLSPLLAPGVDAADWEERHDVLRLLSTLPPRQRQVMAWTYDGYTAAEIAAELGITVEAVRTNLMRARRALAPRLRSDEGTLG